MAHFSLFGRILRRGVYLMSFLHAGLAIPVKARSLMKARDRQS